MLANAIREWRKAAKLQQGNLSTGQGLHDPMPSPSVSVSRKKQKIVQPLPSGSSQPLAGPPSSYPPQPKPAPHQPSSSAAKRGPIGGTKSRKHNVVSEESLYTFPRSFVFPFPFKTLCILSHRVKHCLFLLPPSPHLILPQVQVVGDRLAGHPLVPI